MKIVLYSNSFEVDFEIEFDKFRECYDILAWVGGYSGFRQCNSKNVSEAEYETFIRSKDYRLYKYDRQAETGAIELKLLDDLRATVIVG